MLKLRSFIIKSKHVKNCLFSTLNITRQNASNIKIPTTETQNFDISKLPPIQKMLIEKQKSIIEARMKKENKTKRQTMFFGIFLGLFVIGIYSYTMYALKQEKFLDDFELPDPVETTNKKRSH